MSRPPRSTGPTGPGRRTGGTVAVVRTTGGTSEGAAPSSTTSSPRRALAALVALLALLAAACAGEPEQAGQAGPPATKAEPTTTTASTAPPLPPPVVTRVATATVDEVEVFADIPEPAVAATAPPTPPVATATRVPAIPRPGYLSAGVAHTDAGWRYENPTFFGNPLVFVVTEEHEGWLRVLLPARPNEQQGWVRAGDVEVTQHTFRIELDLSDRLLRAWDGSEAFLETPVVIGAPGTPTPTGTYYITEELPYGGGANPGGPYGAWILPTNGYSEAMTEFDDGLPVIALHGTNNPGAVGTAISNGCVRLPDPAISAIADRVPPGTPISIVE